MKNIKIIWNSQLILAITSLLSGSYMTYLLFKSFSAPGNRAYAIHHLIYPQIPGYILLLSVIIGSIRKNFFTLIIILILSYFTISNIVTYLMFNQNSLTAPGVAFSIGIKFSIMDFLNMTSMLTALGFTVTGYFLIFHYFRKYTQ